MIKMIQKLKNKKGFTLVELIVVIAIIAILTAVIVPLVGRYAANATYTTLQDAAKTVSSTANTVLADITQTGDVFKSQLIIGSKSGTTLTIKADGGLTDSDAGNKTKLETELQSALQEAVPAGASFAVQVTDNTVSAVVYSTKATLTSIVSVVKVGEGQYEYNNNPIGVYGNVTATDKE